MERHELGVDGNDMDSCLVRVNFRPDFAIMMSVTGFTGTCFFPVK